MTTWQCATCDFCKTEGRRPKGEGYELPGEWIRLIVSRWPTTTSMDENHEGLKVLFRYELCPECARKIYDAVNNIMKQGEESAQTKTTSTDDGSGNAG